MGVPEPDVKDLKFIKQGNQQVIVKMVYSAVNIWLVD